MLKAFTSCGPEKDNCFRFWNGEKKSPTGDIGAKVNAIEMPWPQSHSELEKYDAKPQKMHC